MKCMARSERLALEGRTEKLETQNAAHNESDAPNARDSQRLAEDKDAQDSCSDRAYTGVMLIDQTISSKPANTRSNQATLVVSVGIARPSCE
jgi:hypothetical protein